MNRGEFAGNLIFSLQPRLPDLLDVVWASSVLQEARVIHGLHTPPFLLTLTSPSILLIPFTMSLILHRLHSCNPSTFYNVTTISNIITFYNVTTFYSVITFCNPTTFYDVTIFNTLLTFYTSTTFTILLPFPLLPPFTLLPFTLLLHFTTFYKAKPFYKVTITMSLSFTIIPLFTRILPFTRILLIHCSYFCRWWIYCWWLRCCYCWWCYSWLLPMLLLLNSIGVILVHCLTSVRVVLIIPSILS